MKPKARDSYRSTMQLVLFLATGLSSCSRETSIEIPNAQAARTISIESKGQKGTAAVLPSDSNAASASGDESQVSEVIAQDETIAVPLPDGAAAENQGNTLPESTPEPGADVSTPAPAPEPSASPAPTPEPVAAASPAPIPTPAPSPSPSPIALAGTQEIADGRYKIMGYTHSKCFDIPDGKTTSGLQLQVWTCFTGNVNQVFTIEWAGDNNYRIATNSQKSLEAKASGLTANSPLQQGVKTSQDNQLFTFEHSATVADAFVIKAKSGDFFVQPAGTPPQSGTLLEFNVRNESNENQLWKIVKY